MKKTNTIAEKEKKLKAELTETKKELENIKELVAEYFELKNPSKAITTEQYLRRFDVINKLIELCLPKKTNTNPKKG